MNEIFINYARFDTNLPIRLSPVRSSKISNYSLSNWPERFVKIALFLLCWVALVGSAELITIDRRISISRFNKGNMVNPSKG